MKIAIVGSQGKHWTPSERTKVIQKIKDILTDDDYVDVNPADPGDVTYPTLVSGGCGSRDENEKQRFDGGVDVWAEIVADFIGIKKDIKYAENFHWRDTCEDVAPDCPYAEKRINKPIYCTAALGDCPDKRKGFKNRNLEVAQDCDILYCIDPAWREWSGGRWTLERAEFCGKETYLILV